MKNLLLITIFIVTSSCTYKNMHGYNLYTYENDLYKEYLIHESISFLKIQHPPARYKIIFMSVEDDRFSTLFINRLRNIGYAISEITAKESEIIKVKKNEIKLSYSIDYIYEVDKNSKEYYISLQLFSNDSVYSKVYMTNSLDELPQPLGSWSAR